MDFMFTKLLVNDLEKAASFYSSVFGLVEMHRLDAHIADRPVSEVVYQPTYEGGPMFVLVQYRDAATSSRDELMLGFSTKDLDAFVGRLENAGGRVLARAEDASFRHAFAADPEGHQLQITQPIA
jgi:predicted enzyme related to lactoylglutathione lyase